MLYIVGLLQQNYRHNRSLTSAKHSGIVSFFTIVITTCSLIFLIQKIKLHVVITKYNVFHCKFIKGQ